MKNNKSGKFWNNGKVCVRSMECPGDGWVRGRLPYDRPEMTQETKDKIGQKNKGNTAWNKGKKTGPLSESTRKKMSAVRKGKPCPANKRLAPWNKGLTKEDHPSIKSYAEKQTGQKREGNYPSGEDHVDWNPDKQAFSEYKSKVRLITERNYRQDKHKINPCDHPRRLNGMDGGWQLDHILSIKYGFDNNIDPAIIGASENLQMLKWQDNRKKGH